MFFETKLQVERSDQATKSKQTSKNRTTAATIKINRRNRWPTPQYTQVASLTRDIRAKIEQT